MMSPDLEQLHQEWKGDSREEEIESEGSGGREVLKVTQRYCILFTCQLGNQGPNQVRELEEGGGMG